MRETAAQNARHSLLNLSLGGLRILVQENLGGEDDSINTKPALRRLLGDKRLLKGMQFVGRAQPFEGGNLRTVDGHHGCNAGADRLAFYDHRTRPALAQPAAEFCAAQLEVVTQDVEKRRSRVNVKGMSVAVHFQSNCAHI